MNTLKTLLLTGYTLALGLTACNKDDDDTTAVSATDSGYMMRAAQGNLAEITAGNVASTKGMATMIKEFGSQMVTDHTTAQNKLQSVAQGANYTLPTEPDSAHKAMTMQMSMMSGRMFDSTYIHAQVKDHQATLDLLNTIMQNSSMTSLKNYAQESLPVVQMHYRHADSMARTMFP